jgi:hypothetical protein
MMGRSEKPDVPRQRTRPVGVLDRWTWSMTGGKEPWEPSAGANAQAALDQTALPAGKTVTVDVMELGTEPVWGQDRIARGGERRHGLTRAECRVSP